jgi:prolyl oligopeptidase
MATRSIAAGSVSAGRLQVSAALALLVVTGALMRIVGFQALYGMVRRWPTRDRTTHTCSREQVIDQALAAVRRACPYYHREARCLQKSAVLVCLLRSRGLPVELVIGVSKLPFRAHAWVELDGLVLNGAQSVRTRGTVIERC